MSNIEKYRESFELCFGLDAESASTAEFKKTSAWDSVGHMGLIAQIEGAFNIQLDPDDMVDLHSFARGVEILSDKYGIDFSI